MISRVRVFKDLFLWHRWFAWHPVCIHNGNTRLSVWVWWQTIERKFIGQYDGHDTEYRLLGSRQGTPDDPRRTS